MGGKVALQYQAKENLMWYGGYFPRLQIRQIRPRVPSYDDTPFPQRPLKPETLDAFELGFKSTMFDRSLQFNAAVFFDIWKNQQVFNVVSTGPSSSTCGVANRGCRVETNWVPAQNWLVSANIGLLHTKITDVTGIDFDLHQGDFQKGHELPLSPKFTATSRSRELQHRDSQLTLRSDARYQSTSKVKYSPQVPIDEYTSRFELNARVSYDFGKSQQYEVSIFGDNLTNEKYCLEIQDLRGVSGSFYCVPMTVRCGTAYRGASNF